MDSIYWQLQAAQHPDKCFEENELYLTICIQICIIIFGLFVSEMYIGVGQIDIIKKNVI